MPFNRFPGVDTCSAPEMRSTGEVMGWDRSPSPRLSPRRRWVRAPTCPTAAPSSSRSGCRQSEVIVEAARHLHELGFPPRDRRHRVVPRGHAIPATRVIKGL